MPHYEYTFDYSKEIIRRLANEGAETPPLDGTPAWIFVDLSLRILGKTHILSDQRIQREFLQQQSLIHDICEKKLQENFLSTTQQIQEFQVEVYGKFDQLEGKFNQLDGKFDQLEGKFDQLEGKFNQLEGKFNQLEAKVDRKFAQIDIRFDRLEENLRQAMSDISCAIDASHNRLRVRGWDNIHPVRTMDRVGEPAGVPDSFPKTVRKFWALKLRSRCEHPNSSIFQPGA